MYSIFGGKENFRKKLQKRIVNLYKDRMRDYYTGIPDKELKHLVKDKKYDLGKIIVSKAHEFWVAGEEKPGPGVERIIEMPYIPTNFYGFRQVFRKVVEEKDLPEDKRTYMPEKISAPDLVKDENDVLKNELEVRVLTVKDPLKCNRLIARMFRYLESEMDFKYGSDMENFGFRELALTPTQAYIIKESKEIGWEEFQNVGIDCEDMHHFAAACFKAAGMNGRYRLVIAEHERDGDKKMHLGLCVMDDSFEKFVILELTPERRDVDRFISIRNLPVYGESHNQTLKPENVIGSYDCQGVYGSFKVLGDRQPVDEWVNDNITPERTAFPEDIFG